MKNLSLWAVIAAVAVAQAQKIKVLNNGKASITVERSGVQDKAAFIIREISGAGGSAQFSRSPLWQMDLRRLYPPSGGLMGLAPTVLVPDPASLKKGVLELDSSRFLWGACNDTLLTLMWKNIPLSHDSLTVKARIVLSPGLSGPLFHLEAKLSGSGPLAIHSLRFPLLVLDPFGDPTDDRLALPFSGGRYLDNPIARMPRISDSGDLPDSTVSMLSLAWHYPGDMQHQFLYYYDRPGQAGIYLACHDARGHLKRLYYTPDQLGQRLILYLRHFNGANPDEDFRTAFRRFSLVDEYGYTCQIVILKGDWQEAADYYRQMMLAQSAAFDPDSGFLRRGTLYERQDITRQVKETAVSILYQMTEYPAQLDTSDNPHDDKVSDFERVVHVVEFLNRDAPGAKIVISPKNYLGDGEINVVPTDDRGLVGGDFVPLLPELLALWRHRLDRANTLFAYNQDTGNWLSEDYDEEMPRSIIKIENFDPFPRPFRHGINGTATCQGSRYILDRRHYYSDLVLEQSDYQEHPGFEMILWSGEGSLAKCCYAPAVPQTDSSQHNHRIGGGNWWATKWRESLKEMGQRHKSFRPNFCIAAERGPETLMDVTLPGGHTGIYPYQDGYEEIYLAQPFPLFAYIWHDYANQAAGSYPSSPENKGLPSVEQHRLELVQNFVAGRRFSWGLDVGDTDDRGAPEELLPDRLLTLKYLRCLVAAKTLFPQFLTYGKFLHFPEINTGKVTIEFVQSGQSVGIRIPRVWGSALQAPQNWNDPPSGDAGAIGLIFSNFTTESTQISFTPDFPLPAFSRATLVDTSGVHAYSNKISPSQPITLPPLSALIAVFGGATGDVADLNSEPKSDFVLQQNYPNPFNPLTIIRFSIPRREHVTLKVFDVLGREVATLLEGKLDAGGHEVTFKAEQFNSGVYFYQITTGTFTQA
jgi:hypothetical protein